MPGGYPAQGRLYALITKEVIVGSELQPNCRDSDENWLVLNKVLHSLSTRVQVFFKTDRATMIKTGVF